MTPARQTAAAPAPPSAELLKAPLSLRERKKVKTRLALRREAYRLFARQGYESTTVDQIAAAAEVSPSTFFRYFATKEDLVLSDEYDAPLYAALRARPADEPFTTSVRLALGGTLRQIIEEGRAELLARLRLVNQVPALRARMAEKDAEPRALMLDLLTERAGTAIPTLRMRLAATALAAAITEAILYWAERGGQDDLPDLLNEVLDTLEQGLAAS